MLTSHHPLLRHGWLLVWLAWDSTDSGGSGGDDGETVSKEVFRQRLNKKQAAIDRLNGQVEELKQSNKKLTDQLRDVPDVGALERRLQKAEKRAEAAEEELATHQADREAGDLLRGMGIRDPDDQETIRALHDRKGKGAALKDWLKGDGAKHKTVANLLKAAEGDGGTGGGNGDGGNGSKDDTDTEGGKRGGVAGNASEGRLAWPSENKGTGSGGGGQSAGGKLSYAVIGAMPVTERVKRKDEIEAWMQANPP